LEGAVAAPIPALVVAVAVCSNSLLLSWYLVMM